MKGKQASNSENVFTPHRTNKEFMSRVYYLKSSTDH